MPSHIKCAALIKKVWLMVILYRPHCSRLHLNRLIDYSGFLGGINTPQLRLSLIKSVATASNNPKNERTYPRCPFVRRPLRLGIGNTFYYSLTTRHKLV